MARPVQRKGTSNGQFRLAIPTDVQRILAKLPGSYRPRGWGKAEITLTLGTSDKRQMAAEHARIRSEVEARFAALRSGPRTLSQKDAIALAGEVYQGFASGGEDNPGAASVWRQVLAANDAARYGECERASLKIIGDAAARREAMNERFGGMADAVLATKCLIVGEESRWKLVEALARALDDAARKLEKNAEGDYSPDPAARRFPKWQGDNDAAAPQGNGGARKKLTLPALFEQWAQHPEQATQAAATISRYRSVFTAAATFLRNPDARGVTTADVRGYIEGRMRDEAAPLKPRTARDVHKAALSAVYNWAVGKGIVPSNPASDVPIKVRREQRVRDKDATEKEARAIAAAAIAVTPETAVARTLAAALRWCPLLCLYTGCRIGEATQLRREDVSEVDGVWVLRITPEAGTVKAGEARHVPVHSRLVELGFLAFVESATETGPLFFDPATRRQKNAVTPQSQLVAGKVGQWARENGLGDPALVKPLHALRHRFMTLSRRAGIEEQYVEQIVGHSSGRMNRKYGRFPPSVLAREISKLTVELVEGAARPSANI
jgi:integrase